jgi:hypothetical protein
MAISINKLVKRLTFNRILAPTPVVLTSNYSFTRLMPFRTTFDDSLTSSIKGGRGRVVELELRVQLMAVDGFFSYDSGRVHEWLAGLVDSARGWDGVVCRRCRRGCRLQTTFVRGWVWWRGSGSTRARGAELSMSMNSEL